MMYAIIVIRIKDCSRNLHGGKIIISKGVKRGSHSYENIKCKNGLKRVRMW